MTRKGVLHSDMWRQVEEFERDVDERLNDQGFMAQDPSATFFLQDNDNMHNAAGGVITTVTMDEYGDTLTPDALEGDDVDDEVIDKYLNTELIGMGTGAERRGCVIKRAKGTAEQPIGRGHANPLLDTR